MEHDEVKDLFDLVPLELILKRIPNDKILLSYQEYLENPQNTVALMFKSGIRTSELSLDLDAIIENPRIVCRDFNPDVHQSLYPALFFFQTIEFKNIYNQNTDGSMGLVVVGDLIADNIVVGGQSILVCGDLKVSNVFWGDYNHSLLHVTGSLSSQVFLATDEYNYDTENKNLKAPYILSDALEETELEDFDPYYIRSIFKPELCIVFDGENEDWGWGSHLDREKIIHCLKSSFGLIQNPIEIKSRSIFEREELNKRPRVFDASEFDSLDSLQLQRRNVIDLVKVLDSSKKNNSDVSIDSYLIYWSPKSDEIGPAEDKAHLIIFTHPESSAQFLIGELEDDDSEVKSGEHIPHSDRFPMVAWYRPNSESEFYDVFSLGLSNQLNQLQGLWRELLFSVECSQYFSQQLNTLVEREQFYKILEYPVVKNKFNDYNSEENNGFWAGLRYYTFNTLGMNDCDGLISVALEIKDRSKSGVKDFRRFYYWYDDAIKPSGLSLKYMSSQEDLTDDIYSGTSRSVQVTDWSIFQEAVKLWPKIEKDVQEENYAYLGDLEYEASKKLKKENLKKNQSIKPHEYVSIDGIDFKVLTIQEADDILIDLKTSNDELIFQIFDDPYNFHIDMVGAAFFLMAEHSVQSDKFILKRTIENYPEIYVLGYIFRSDLEVQQAVSSELVKYSPSLVVYGNLSSPNIVLTGGLHYVSGDVHSESIIASGIGEFHVMGSIVCELVSVSYFGFYVNKFKEVTAVCAGTPSSVFLNADLKTHDGQSVRKQLVFPATHEHSDLVLADFLAGEAYAEHFLIDSESLRRINDGESVLDDVKRLRIQNNIPGSMEAEIFRMIFEDAQYKKRFQKPDEFCIDADSFTYKMKTFFELENQKQALKQELSLYDQSSRIRMRAVKDLASSEIQLFLEYLNENLAVEMMWAADSASQILEMNCVRRAIRQVSHVFISTASSTI